MSTFIQPKFSFDCFDPDGEFDEARLQRPIAGEHSGYHRAPEVDADELRIRLPSDLHLLDVEVFLL